ncbi:MAG: dihydrofolate reductase family protein [Nitriliruptorales bacterium]
MRRLLPDTREEDLGDLYTALAFPPPPAGRPYVYLDMVASADGAATVDGRTRELGRSADALAFSRLREWCDAILVGASTVRIEDYGPPRPKDEARARREARGLDPYPRLVVVTRSLALNPGGRLFSEASRPPVVLVPEDADEDRLGALRGVAEVVQAGAGGVDLVLALGELRRLGVAYLLCEGGPTLNAELLARGLVDELFLTVSPQLVGLSDLRIVDGPLAGSPSPLELVELREHEGELLCRYRVLEGAGSEGVEEPVASLKADSPREAP